MSCERCLNCRQRWHEQVITLHSIIVTECDITGWMKIKAYVCNYSCMPKMNQEIQSHHLLTHIWNLYACKYTTCDILFISTRSCIIVQLIIMYRTRAVQPGTIWCLQNKQDNRPIVYGKQSFVYEGVITLKWELFPLTEFDKSTSSIILLPGTWNMHL